MAICMEARSSHHTHGVMVDSYHEYDYHNAFDSDFYKCLCEDLAKELDFPDETDLRRVSQFELFGSSWDTDPYKQLLLRCLDHSLPRLREQPVADLSSPDGSIDLDTASLDDFDLEASVPTNPPPSPALSAANYVLSKGLDETFDLDDAHAHTLGAPVKDRRLKSMHFDDMDLLPSETGGADDGGLASGETAEARRTRWKRQHHRRVASTGLLATVVTGDGSITWHFKEFS